MMSVRRPGLEPGTPAWKADMLTPTPTTLFDIDPTRLSTLHLITANRNRTPRRTEQRAGQPSGTLVPTAADRSWRPGLPPGNRPAATGHRPAAEVKRRTTGIPLTQVSAPSPARDQNAGVSRTRAAARLRQR